MTNFQGTPPSRLSREQVLLWGPVLVGGVLAAAVAGLMLWPVLRQLQLDQQQLTDLQQQDSRLPILRQQLTQVQDNLAKGQQRQQRILNLIAGSGEINTFMAQLSQEAVRSGVLLDGYEPVTATASATAPATGPAGQPAAAPPPPSPTPGQTPDKAASATPPGDPLLSQGLTKTSVLITARGSGPQLQQFLRRLERLSLLVVQSDLNLKHETPQQEAGKPKVAGFTQLRLNLSLYSRATEPR